VIDLHRHLEGSVRFETLVELAHDVGLGLSRAELRRRSSMKGEKPGFLRFLSKFQIYRGLYPSRDWIERVAFEAAEDAKNEGVQYLELRFSPTHFGRRMDAAGEDVAEWVARGARRAGIDLSFIATFGRDFGVKGNEPTTRAVKGTAVFSGLDLAGTESVPAAPFIPLFRALKLPATIHAGEACGAANVREAMDRFGAKRIGHGVRILGDRALVRRAQREGVVFETCPTSEVQTGAAKAGRRHPVARMKDVGLKVTINTDDPSVCRTSMRAEYGAARKMGFTDGDLRRALLNSALAAFLSESRRRKLLARLAALE
jgi:adenosine deaminase